MATHTLDEWTLAGAVDVFGTSSFPTWLMNDDHVEHLMNLDTARDAAAGKPYWQTELQGGRGRRAGTASTGHPRPAIVTMEMWNAIAAGARGILFWQWRPELLGPESPGYGLCAVDGGLTDRARAAGTFAAMVQHVPELAETRPVPSSVGLIVSRRTAVHAFATDRTMDIYRRSVMGAYRMLLDADLEPVFVHEDQIERGEVPTSLRAMYHPMPAVIGDGAVKNLSRWVAEGGRLVSEGAPGEYDARGCHRHQLPPGELRDAFGVRAVEVDAITGALPFTLDGFPASGGWIRDVFELDGASPAGHFADGTVAASRNTYGDGEAVLIATCPSVTYETNTSAATRAAVTRLLGDRGRSLLRWGTPKPGLMLRRHMLPDGRPAVFALNWTDVPALLRAEGPTRVHGLSRSVDAKVGDSFTLEALQGVFAVAHRQP
jgi:beta-galactosidase